MILKRSVKSILIGLFCLVLAGAFSMPASAETIKLSKTTLSMVEGNKETLKVEGTTLKVRWKSSKSSVASVTGKGVVKAKKKGKATITATVNKVKYTCKVTVTAGQLNATKQTIGTGSTFQLKLIGPKAKSFKSSKKSVAKVSSKGVVTGVKPGTATITVKGDNKKSYKCKITVTDYCANLIDYDDAVVGLPMFTGDPEVDYMAEQMIQEAGVKMTDSEETKIKKIFCFIGMNFTHTKDTSHTYYVGKKAYYDLSSANPDIAAYQKVTDQMVKDKKAQYVRLIYSYYSIKARKGGLDMKYHLAKQNQELTGFMNARVGTCLRQADCFIVLCAHVGVKAGPTYGKIGSSEHYYAWAKINGVTYYYDPDAQCSHKTNMYSDRYYKIPKSKISSTHTIKYDTSDGFPYF